jgi:hypothetical protein
MPDTKKAAECGPFYRHITLKSALTSLETGIALADHEHLAATTDNLAVTVPRLGGLQRVKHLHGRLLTLFNKLSPQV